MNIPTEIILGLVPSITTLLAVMYRVGKSEGKFNEEIKTLHHIIDSSVTKDANADHVLLLKLESSNDGFTKDFRDVWEAIAKIEQDFLKISKRLNKVERFLMKTTEFDKDTNS